MTKRFVVAAEPLTAEQDGQLREYLHQFGGWWHWIGNVWLLVTDDDAKVSAVSIRDKVQELNDKARVVVFEFPEDLDWAASGTRNAQGRAMHEWIKGTWAAKKG